MSVSPTHDIVLHYLSITSNSNKHDKDKDLCMFNLSGQIADSLVILAKSAIELTARNYSATLLWFKVMNPILIFG